MAFFASIDDLPAAKESWKRKKPKTVDPPVPPKPPKPKPKPKQPHHCTDGFRRVKFYQFGIFMGWTCDKDPRIKPKPAEKEIIPYQKPLRTPLALIADLTPGNPAEHFGGLLDVRVEEYVNENIEDN